MSDKRTRLEAAVAGEQLDSLPVAFWRHFPGDDQGAGSLAKATIQFQSTWEFDFVKVSPTSNYCTVDWGVRTRWVGNQEGTREYIQRRVQRPEEYESLEELDVRDGELGKMLNAVELIEEGLPAGTPYIFTIFSPLTIVRYLRGDTYLVDMRRHPERVLHALEVVTGVYERFVDEVISIGAAGIFLAVQPASYQIMTEAEYKQFGEPFDRRILDAASQGWFNLLHVHGDDVMWDLMSTYPVEAINWHDRQTPPTLAGARPKFDGALVGGVKQWETLLQGDPDDVRAQVRDARDQVDDTGLVVGAGCVIPVNTPWRNIRAAVEAAREPRQ